jgi:Protein of unknown function (DUF4232)
VPRGATALLSVIGMWALAGCGGNSQPEPRRLYTYTNTSVAPNPAGGKIYTDTTTSGSSVSAPAHCQSKQLTVRVGPAGAAAGSIGISVYFKNASRSTCSLDGYPRLQMLTSTGRSIPTRHGVSTTVPQLRPRLVSLTPGASATFYTGFADRTGYADDRCPGSARVAITPPDTNTPITVAWRIAPYGGSIQNLQCGKLAVSPVIPGIDQHP